MAETVSVLIEGGKATSGPPVGSSLGPLGVNVGQIVSDINQKTSDMSGMQVPVKIIVNDDKSYDIEIGTPPTSALLKKELNLQKASGKPGSELIADSPIDIIIKVARIKVENLLARDMKAAVKEVIGTCQSMGIKIEGLEPREAIAAVNKGEWEARITGKKELKEVSAEELAAKQKELQAEIEEHRKEEEAEAAEEAAAAPAEEASAEGEEKPAESTTEKSSAEPKGEAKSKAKKE